MSQITDSSDSQTEKQEERRQKLLGMLPEGWQNEVAEMFKRGCSQTEVLSYLGLTRMQNAELRKICKEYDDIIDRGTLDAEAWFERIAREALSKETRMFNHGLWWYHMKYRYGARDIPLDKNQKGNNLQSKTKEVEDVEKYRATPTEADFMPDADGVVN